MITISRDYDDWLETYSLQIQIKFSKSALLQSMFQLFILTSWNKVNNGCHFHTWSILIIHGFHICTFAYLLKFIFNLQINTHDTFVVFHAHVQDGEKFEASDRQVPT